MSSSQIQAARILLNKVLPDLKAVEVASEASYSGDLKSISNAYLLELLEAGKEFDDIVIWISEFELKAKMVEAGKLP